MKNGKARDLLKIILFVERENVIDTMIFHNHAVDDVTTPEW
jgi:hypothetical protein